jgi:hypothetical protein
MASMALAQSVKTGRAIDDADLAFVDRFIHQPRAGGPLAYTFHDDGLSDVSIWNVRVGHPDLNDDGEPELLVVLEHILYCGTAGCPAFIFTRCRGEYLLLEEFTYEGMWLAGEARGGWRTFLTSERIWRWDGLAYDSECLPEALQCLQGQNG